MVFWKLKLPTFIKQWPVATGLDGPLHSSIISLYLNLSKVKKLLVNLGNQHGTKMFIYK